MTDPKITHDEELALHLYLQQAEDLARLIRITSRGQLTLTAVENRRRAQGTLDAAGVVRLDMEAHDYASILGGHSVNQNEFTDKLMALRSAEADTADRFRAAWEEAGR